MSCMAAVNFLMLHSLLNSCPSLARNKTETPLPGWQRDNRELLQHSDYLPTFNFVIILKLKPISLI